MCPLDRADEGDPLMEKDGDEARQGQPSPNHMVRHALIGGIVLVVIAFIVAWVVMA
jgi:hypothetical protein